MDQQQQNNGNKNGNQESQSSQTQNRININNENMDRLIINNKLPKMSSEDLEKRLRIRTIRKSTVLIITILNLLLGILLKSWGNFLVGSIVGFVYYLWISTGKYIKLKKTLREFSLFNTWIIMRIAMKLYYGKKHSWKDNPPTLLEWFQGATILNEDMSYIITIMLTTVVPIIIWGLFIK